MRRTGIALMTLVLALSLTACGAGFNAETRNSTQVTDGVEGAIINDQSEIKVRNLLIVETAEKAGVIVGTLLNTSDTDDALLGVAINSKVATLTGNTTLSKNSPIIFEGASANAKAVVAFLDVAAGQNVTVTLFFARGGKLTLTAIVRDQRDTYAGISAEIKAVTTTKK
jgi:copper(I)-binding protein